MRSNLLGAFTIFSCAFFSGYLINFYLKYIPGSIYRNNFFFAISDIIGFSLSAISLYCLPLRLALRMGFTGCAFGGILYLVYGHRDE